jgi:hypothetical protein
MANRKDTWVEKDYKDYTLALLERHVTDDRSRRVRISESFDYVYNQNANPIYRNILSSMERTADEISENSGSHSRLFADAPWELINFDSISPKVNLMVGELDQRGFDISVLAENKDSVVRKRAILGQH